MRRREFLRWGGFGLLLAWSAISLAAGSAAREAVPLTRVYVSHTCSDPASTPGIRVADTQDQADGLWSLCRGRLVLGGTPPAPSLDMDANRLIYIHMGARRTGGYRLDLAGDGADIVDRTLVVPVIWEAPAKGALVTQALTHPCLLLAVPRGNYRRIEIVDEAGQTRLSHILPAQTP